MGGALEHSETTIAFTTRAYDNATMLPHSRVDDSVMKLEGRSHVQGMLLPQPRARHDVGEQERDSAGW